VEWISLSRDIGVRLHRVESSDETQGCFGGMGLEPIIACAIAGVLTFFELASIFSIPWAISWKPRLWAYIWFLLFSLANAAFAYVIYDVVAALPGLETLPSTAKAIAGGILYLMIVRMKLMSVRVGEKEISIGFELLYDGARSFVHNQINSVVKPASARAAMAEAGKRTLEDLRSQVMLDIELDPLLTSQEKEKRSSWLTNIMKENSSEIDKKLMLAAYLLRPRQPS
jgi:hypothetical protein